LNRGAHSSQFQNASYNNVFKYDYVLKIILNIQGFKNETIPIHLIKYNSKEEQMHLHATPKPSYLGANESLDAPGARD